jgi:hypothetical protein
VYYYTSSLYALERGLVYRYLGRDNAAHNEEAITSLAAALEGLGASRSSEWAAEYVYQLAIAYVHADAPDRACATAMEVMETARATESVRLFERVRRIYAQLARRWPNDPAISELDEALR